MIDSALNRPAVLCDYLAAPDRLAKLMAGLDELSLNRALDVGSWTIRQLAHHIVDGHIVDGHIVDGDDVWSVGIKAAIGNPDGVFTLQWYWDVPQTTWAERWHYADRDVQPALDLFRANRQCIAQLLEAAPEAWERAITIPWPGQEAERVSVANIVAMQARHALEHIKEIEVIFLVEGQTR